MTRRITLLALAALVSLLLSPAAATADPSAPVPPSRTRELKPGGFGPLLSALPPADSASASSSAETSSPDAAQPMNSWSRIVYQSGRDGNYEIYGSRPNGAELQRLTHHPASDGRPDQSYAHGRIAFVSDRTGNMEIFTMAADGSDVRQVTNDPGEDNYPSWSPDGKRIAFASDRSGTWDVYVMDADGGALTPIIAGPEEDYEPVWSPDGKSIAWLRTVSPTNSLLRILNLDTGAIQNLNAFRYTGGIAWSPDGEQIAYECDCNVNGTLEVVNVLGVKSYPWVVTIYEGNSLTDALMGGYSPDGKNFVITLLQYQTIDGRVQLSSARLAQVAAGQLRFLYGNGPDLNGNWQRTDFTPPRSRFNLLPSLTQAQTYAPLSWTGSDTGGSGIEYYDAQISRNGEPWEDFFWWNTAEKGNLYAMPGRVKLRLRARDAAGNVEPWPASPDGDTQTTAYSGLAEGWVRDTRGLPVPRASITGPGNPTTPFRSAPDGRYEAYSFAGFNPLTVVHAGYGSLPGHADRSWPVLRVDFALPPKVNAVSNGGFEDALQGWQVVGSDGVAHEDSGHSGKGAVRLGIHAPLKPGAYGISQQVTVPPASGHPTLSFLAARDTSDMPFSMLRATVTDAGIATDVPLTWREGPQWSHAWADLSAFGGKTVTLTLTITQTGWEVGGSALVDEVSVGEWHTPSITLVAAPTQLPGELVVRGENFLEGATVSIADLPMATTFIDAQTLKAQLYPGSPIGARSLVVTNPGGEEAQTQVRIGLPVFLPLTGAGD